MPPHECVLCGSYRPGVWSPIRSNEVTPGFEAICEDCIDYCAICDCCGDTVHHQALEEERPSRPGSFGKSMWRCPACVESCGGTCWVLVERSQLAEMRELLHLEGSERDQQLSEVRDSLRLTLERIAKRNERPNLRGGEHDQSH